MPTTKPLDTTAGIGGPVIKETKLVDSGRSFFLFVHPRNVETAKHAIGEANPESYSDLIDKTFTVEGQPVAAIGSRSLSIRATEALMGWLHRYDIPYLAVRPSLPGDNQFGCPGGTLTEAEVPEWFKQTGHARLAVFMLEKSELARDYTQIKKAVVTLNDKFGWNIQGDDRNSVMSDGDNNLLIRRVSPKISPTLISALRFAGFHSQKDFVLEPDPDAERPHADDAKRIRIFKEAFQRNPGGAEAFYQFTNGGEITPPEPRIRH